MPRAASSTRVLDFIAGLIIFLFRVGTTAEQKLGPITTPRWHRLELSVRGQCGASGFVRSVTFEHRALDTQDDRSFASFSLPADMGSKRNSALHDTADTGEEEPPVKIQQVEFPFWQVCDVLRLPPWREPSRTLS